MIFKDTKEMSSELIDILDSIRCLPKISCSSCGTLYRGEQVDFVCDKCFEKEANAREEKKRKDYQIQTLLNLSNIPKRYKRAVFKAKTNMQNEVLHYFVENFSQTVLDKSSDVLLFGAIGTGKTYLSCAFAIELIHKKQKKIKYITEYDLLSLYFEKEYQTFKKFKVCEILILDEIGKRVLADWQRIQLEELLSHRYNEKLPTIYISNLEQKAFKEFLGSRLADRLKENKLQRFAFNGESLRA